MKKTTITAIVIILLFALNLQAQKGKELIFGFGGALTNTWIVNQNFYGEPEVDYAPKMGYAGSFHLGYNFNERISVMTELQYSAQGQKYEGKQSFNGEKYDVKRDISLRYMNVPLFFKMSFGEKNTHFRFMVGPQFGILLDATQDYTRNGSKLNYGVDLPKPENLDGETFIPDDDDIKDRFESSDFTVVMDVGADIHLSDQFFINAGVRGNYGFGDINAAAYQINDLDGEYLPSHNLWGGLYVGINYKLDVQGYSQRSF